MGLVQLPNPLTDGTTARGSEVLANDLALANTINGQLTDVNVSGVAAISGLKISTTAGLRVPTAAIEDNAITTTKLKSDATAGSPTAAVQASHITGGAVTTEKLAATAVLSGKIKILSTVFFPNTTINPGVTISGGTLLASVGTPLFISQEDNGAGDNRLKLGLRFDGGINTYNLTVCNLTASPIATGLVVYRLTYISVT